MNKKYRKHVLILCPLAKIRDKLTDKIPLLPFYYESNPDYSPFEKLEVNLFLSEFDLKFLSLLLKLFLLLLLFLNVTIIFKKLYFCTDYASIVISKIFIGTVNIKSLFF